MNEEKPVVLPLSPVKPLEPAEEAVQSKEDRLLFNVMPRISSSDVVQPSVKVQEPAFLDQQGTVSRINMKYVKYGFGVVLLIGAAIAAYFFVPGLFVEKYDDQNLLVKPTSNKPQKTPEELLAEKKEKWLLDYFGSGVCENPGTCGDDVDTDRDGLVNLQEFERGTDPNNKDSDGDGLADGDEVNIFSSDPLQAYTSEKKQYSDLEFARGGYSLSTDEKYSPDQLILVKAKIQENGIHQPTFTSLGEMLGSVYEFTGSDSSIDLSVSTSTATSTLDVLKDFDQTIEGKTERDIQRSSTIQNIGIALLRYKEDYDKFPETSDFQQMYSKIRPYLKVATNPNDPVNKNQYVYSYSSSENNDDFTLSFFSEVAGLLIKRTSKDAISDKVKAEAAIFDNQRKNDLESLRQSLLLYSAKNLAGNADYVFPSIEKYKTSLVPEFVSSIPKDPKSQAEYEYQVSEDFSTFTLKVALDVPRPGTTGYLCNQEECREY